MDGRQVLDGKGMMAGYGQFGITVVQKAPPHPTGIGLEVITAQAILYDYFPDTCRAEQKLVLWIFQQGIGLSGEFIRFSRCP